MPLIEYIDKKYNYGYLVGFAIGFAVYFVFRLIYGDAGRMFGKLFPWNFAVNVIAVAAAVIVYNRYFACRFFDE